MSKLTAMGWKFPEPFKAKAADGKTELYGLIWRPNELQPVEEVSGGREHLHRTARRVRAEDVRRVSQSAAGDRGLGSSRSFVDGRGTALRSRAFRAFAYHNLGFGAGGDDHITVFKQMAAKYPYMDLTRVGIWGQLGRRLRLDARDPHASRVLQGGGFVRRLPRQPDGQGDLERAVDGMAGRQALRGGRRITRSRQSCAGKLFLAHGDVDENVPMPATIKLVDALVKANKDFEFLIMPNRPHGFGNDPYFVASAMGLLRQEPARRRSAVRFQRSGSRA